MTRVVTSRVADRVRSSLIEALESRRLLSVNPAPFSFTQEVISVDGGPDIEHLTVRGTAGTDKVTVVVQQDQLEPSVTIVQKTPVGKRTSTFIGNFTDVDVSLLGGNDIVRVLKHGPVTAHSLFGQVAITVDGGSGDDLITVDTSADPVSRNGLLDLSVHAWGRSGNDVLKVDYTGTGQAGDVTFDGGSGSDVLDGGTSFGTCNLSGGDGHDFLFGGKGTNLFHPGRGVKLIFGRGYNNVFNLADDSSGGFSGGVIVGNRDADNVFLVTTKAAVDSYLKLGLGNADTVVVP